MRKQAYLATFSLLRPNEADLAFLNEDQHDLASVLLTLHVQPKTIT